MNKDIYDNQKIEYEKYIQGKYQNNFNEREEDENNNYIKINPEQMFGEESNKGEVFINQNDNDINELDVSVNDNNNEYNLDNINNIDEHIDDMNNNLYEEIEEPINNMENNLMYNNMNIGKENYELNDNFMNERKEDNDEGNIQGENYEEYDYKKNFIEDTNNMNNNDAYEENGEKINNGNIKINTINSLENIDDKNYYNNMNYFNNIKNYNNKNNINQNTNNNNEIIENDLNDMNNNINMNDKFFGNEEQEENENEVSKLSIINNIKDINKKFFGLEAKFKKVKEENQNLKIQLELEKNKNGNITLNKAQIYQNCLKQGNKLIDDIKSKNSKLHSQIDDLESENDSLNYQLIEANKKIKFLEDKLKQTINNSNVNNNIGINKDNNALNEIELMKKKIYDNELTISKLIYDKKKLEKKMENMNIEYNNKINLMINYKNSEINLLRKLLKEYYTNNNINENMNDNNNLDFNRNENANEKELRLILANKDKIIQNLNLRLKKYIKDFKNTVETSQLFHESIGEQEKIIHKLINDKNKLCKIIEETKRANNPINKEIFENMQKKLGEYKNKIVILKRKINELYNINKKYDRDFNGYNNISPFSHSQRQKTFKMFGTANNFYNAFS